MTGWGGLWGGERAAGVYLAREAGWVGGVCIRVGGGVRVLGWRLGGWVVGWVMECVHLWMGGWLGSGGPHWR